MVWSKWVKNSLPAIFSMHLTPVVVQFSVGSARQSGDPPTICVAMPRCLAMPRKRQGKFNSAKKYKRLRLFDVTSHKHDGGIPAVYSDNALSARPSSHVAFWIVNVAIWTADQTSSQLSLYVHFFKEDGFQNYPKGAWVAGHWVAPSQKNP